CDDPVPKPPINPAASRWAVKACLPTFQGGNLQLPGHLGGDDMTYDYIIVGGGSAGYVMAHRLSAESSNKGPLCRAGQGNPDGKVPPEILDSYPGTAYFDPRFHWQELRVHTEIVSHNRPEDRPALRKYEQARVLGGGSSINGQLANRGAPTDYDEWA